VGKKCIDCIHNGISLCYAGQDDVFNKLESEECPKYQDCADVIMQKMKPAGNQNYLALETGAGSKESDDEGVDYHQLAIDYYIKNPVRTEKGTRRMWRFDGKIWRDDAEVELQKFLTEFEWKSYSPYHLTKFIHHVQSVSFVDNLEEPPPELIPCENCIVNALTGETVAYSPLYFFTGHIHAQYAPVPYSEKFLNWLEQMVPDADDRAVIQEIFGYCLYRAMPIHALFFLVGTGRNGKTTLINTLREIIGPENCASVPLEMLDERFQLSFLQHRFVNIVTEPKLKALRTPVLKALTGGDLVGSELKGKQKFVNFVNYCKIIVIGNRLPPVFDPTVAWWRRVVVINFPFEIPIDQVVPNIERTWLDDERERSGVLRWALDGLKRLLEQGRFTESESRKQVEAQYRRWSEPVEYFVEKYCEFGRDLFVEKRELYDRYCEVADDEDLPDLSDEEFGKQMKKVPRVTSSRIRRGNERVRVWKGVALKDIEWSKQSECPGVCVSPQNFAGGEEVYKDNGIREEGKSYREIEIPGPLGHLGPDDSDDGDILTLLKWLTAMINERQDGVPRDEFVQSAQRLGYSQNYIETILKRLIYDGKVTTIGEKLLLRYASL